MKPNVDLDGPCSVAELRMLEELYPKVRQINGKDEPQTVSYGFMLELMEDALAESGRLVNNLDELVEIAQRHGQWPIRKPISERATSSTGRISDNKCAEKTAIAR